MAQASLPTGAQSHLLRPAGSHVLPSETRRKPVHGGSEPASLLATVSEGSTCTPA